MIEIGNKTVYMGGALPEEKGTSGSGLELLDTLESFNLNFISGGVTPEEWATVYGPSPLLLPKAKANGLKSVKLFGGTEQSGTPTPTTPQDIVCNNGTIKAKRQSGLPLGYQMIEWLKSTGTIVITGFKTKSTQEIETVFYREWSGASYLYASDTATSGTTNTTAYLTSAAGNWRWDGKSYSIIVPTGIKVTSIQNKDGVWLNGTQSGWYSNAGDFVSTNDLRLSAGENTTVRIYSQTIREGDTVTLDLVPVQRLSDSSYGFYDKVSGEFYTNTEATFVAGDVIDDPVEIYTDGTVETVMLTGKNLFDKSTALLGDISTSGGYTSRTYRVVSDYIPARYGQTFVGSGTLVDTDGVNYGSSVIKAFYKADKSYIAGSRGSVTGAFTINDNECAYIRIVFFNQSLVAGKTVSMENSVLQLELGSSPTSYAPYYNGGTATAEMLLSVGNYKDVQSVLDGAVTRNVGVKVLDGTETFTRSSSGAMITAISDVKIGAENVPINTHFALETSPTSIAAGTQRFGASATQIYSANYYMKPLTTMTVSDFKQWLADQYNAGTPVIVVYPLATPATETVTPQTLQVQAGTNILQITQASIDNLPLEATYKRGK